MTITWKEFPDAVVKAGKEEVDGVRPTERAITSKTELLGFIRAYTGFTYQELISDELFKPALDFLIREDQVSRGIDPQHHQFTRITAALPYSALTPVEAMKMHGIDWF